MTKRGKIIIGALLLLVVVVVACVVVFNNKGADAETVQLTDELKEKIAIEYNEWNDRKPPTDFSQITWYDRDEEITDGVEKDFSWRYIGTYGDCIAVLHFYSNTDWLGWPLTGSFSVYCGFRKVDYHREASVWIYNTEDTIGEATRLEEFQDNHLLNLWDVIDMKLNWLTDSQIEQIAEDVEAMSKVNQ